jgi:integrase
MNFIKIKGRLNLMKFPNIVEKSKKIEKETGKKILSVKEVANYLRVKEDDVRELISLEELKCIDSKFLRSIDVAKFEIGEVDSNVTKTENTTLANSYLDNSLFQALPYIQNLAQDAGEDEFLMAVKEYGEGSVYWNYSRQCYQMAFYLEVNGERKRKIVSGKDESEVTGKAAVAKAIANGTVTQATAAMPMIIVQGQSGQEKSVTRKTVNAVVDEWLAMEDGVVACSTFNWYSNMAKHVKEKLGVYKEIKNKKEIFKERIISDLHFDDVQKFLNLVARPQGVGGKVMSLKLVQGVKLVLNLVISYAIKKNYLTENIADGIKIPKAKKTKKDEKFLNEQQIHVILKVVENNPKYTMIVKLLMMTGLRIGEALALEWKDIDVSNKIINIRQALSETGGVRRYDIGNTKTAGSIRTIPLDYRLAELLQDWKQCTLLNTKLTDKMKVNKTANFIFVNEDGRLINYQTLQNNFQGYLKRNGIGELHCTFHMLRHSYGSLLLEKGVELVTVSALLGHSSIRLTADIYCTVTQKLKTKELVKSNSVMDAISQLTV